MASPADYALTGAPGALVTTDPAEAVAGAHAVYTDVWVSMGDEESADARRAALAPYRLDDALLDLAAPGAIALHCLPAHPGEEITEELLYGPRQRIWEQAENRRHAQKALLELLVRVTGAVADAARPLASGAGRSTVRRLRCRSPGMCSPRVWSSRAIACRRRSTTLVARGRLTRQDAEDLVQNLVEISRRQTQDALAEIEGIVGRSAMETRRATRSRARIVGAAVRRAPGSDRAIRTVDIVRRATGRGAGAGDRRL